MLCCISHGNPGRKGGDLRALGMGRRRADGRKDVFLGGVRSCGVEMVCVGVVMAEL